MAGFNGSGSYVRVHDWTNDLAAVIPVTASRMDAEHDAFATGLSSVICRDGQSTTTARIPFAAGTSAAAGTTAAVAYAQTNDLNTGMYFPASDEWGLVAGGTSVLSGTATGVSVTGTFAASGNVAINTNKFTVAAASGNTLVAGTLDVTGATGLTGNLAINTNKFNVTAASGNTAIAGTLSAVGDFAVNTNKFTVTASSGNTAVAGTLAVTGNSTLTGTLTVGGQAVTGKIPTRQMLTSGTGATYTTPAGARLLRIKMIGGGGGGAGASANNGGAGGNTSFESWTAVGGSAGTAAGGAPGAGGSGGATGTGTLHFRMAGARGGSVATDSATIGRGGSGGPSQFGASSGGLTATNTAGTAGPTNSGAGGAGGSNGNQGGGGGGAGEYLEFEITSPSATYTYTIGAAGTAGSAGGQAGGAGGAGFIVVDEYY